MIASSCIFSSGTERFIIAASPPSAITQLAPGRTPTSRSSVATGTPVHSLVDSSPSICCGVTSVGMRVQVDHLRGHVVKDVEVA